MLSLTSKSIFLNVLIYLSLICITLVMSNPAASQQVTQKSQGACSPNINDVSGAVVLTFSCPNYLLRSYRYELSGEQSEFLAAHYEVNTKAINNFLKQLGEEEVAPYQLQDKLEQLITEVVSMRDDLSQISTRGASKEIWKKAIEAVNNGDLQLAAELYEKLSNSIKDDLTGLLQQTRDYAVMLSLKGRNEILIHQYGDAVESLTKALEILPSKFQKDRTVFLVTLSEALHLAPNKPNSERGLQLEISSQALESASNLAESDKRLFLRAATNNLRALFIADNLEDAKNLFNNTITPILNDPNVRSMPETLFCFSCMGGVFMNAGEHGQAIIVLEEGIKFSEKLLIPDNVALASIYLNLGRSYEDSQRSLVAFEKGLDLLLARYPEKGHPDIANLLSSIARETEDATKRDQLISDALEVAIKTVGIDKIYAQFALEVGLFNKEPVIDSTGGNFSSTYQLRETGVSQKYDNAVIDSIHSHYNPSEHGYMLGDYYYQLATVHLLNGYNAEAAEFYKLAIDNYGEVKHHINYAYSIFTLGQLLHFYGLGSNEEVKEYLLASTPIYEAIEGEFAKYTHDTRVVTIEFLVNIGDFNTADELLKKWNETCPSSTECEHYWQMEELEIARKGP